MAFPDFPHSCESGATEPTAAARYNRPSNMPRLSVVIPVYNAEQSIVRAVRSALDSSFRDLECVVVDDGSTDGTRDALSMIDDPRLRVIPSEHRGVAHAANLAIAEARAPFIARMDADDFCHPYRFEKQIEILESGQVDGVGGRVRIVDANGKPVETMERYQDWVNDNLDNESIRAFRFVESPLVNPTVTARREVFELGHREGPFPEDYDLWLRAMEHGFAFAKLPDIVLDWTDGPGRLTRAHSNYTDEAFDRCRREHLMKGPLRDTKSVNAWGAGQTGKPWLRWLREQGIVIRCVIEVSERKIGERIHGAPVVSSEDLPPPDGTPLLIAVGAPGARDLILSDLLKAGYQPGRDAWFVA